MQQNVYNISYVNYTSTKWLFRGLNDTGTVSFKARVVSLAIAFEACEAFEAFGVFDL